MSACNRFSAIKTHQTSNNVSQNNTQMLHKIAHKPGTITPFDLSPQNNTQMLQKVTYKPGSISPFDLSPQNNTQMLQKVAHKPGSL